MDPLHLGDRAAIDTTDVLVHLVLHLTGHFLLLGVRWTLFDPICGCRRRHIGLMVPGAQGIGLYILGKTVRTGAQGPSQDSRERPR